MKKVSVILVDWSVRESFHAIDYLNEQTIPRSDYEIIWVEYYSRRPELLQRHAAQGTIDQWLVLGKTGMYRKHSLYNEGVAASNGEIVVIADSDAMFSPTFLESILTTFEANRDERIVLYLDEVRSGNKRFYPFRKVRWVEVMGASGLLNWDSTARKPHGLTTGHDALHYRNYGACFCAKRKDVIEMGGFDEAAAYHCFLCGPYELGWRMVNAGYREIWHEGEWLLHTWHPWVKERNEVMGESDGLGLNAAALEMRKTGRVLPLEESPKIRDLRTGKVAEPVPRPQLSKPGRVATIPLRSRLVQWRHRYGTIAANLLAPLRVERALVVAEHGRAWEPLIQFAEFGGIVGRIEWFFYGPLYHRYGQEEMSHLLLQRCARFKPQLVIFLPLHNDADGTLYNAVEPTAATMRSIRSELGIKVYVHVLNAAKCNRCAEFFALADYVGIIDSMSVFDSYASNPKAIRGYPAVNPLDFYDQGLLRDIDVVFWGSVPLGSQREEYVQFLRNNGIAIATREYRVSAARYTEVLNRSKIALSLCRDSEPEGTLRKRAFEVMSCKSLLMEDERMASKRLFDKDKDFITFNGKEELLQKVRYYLEHEQERKTVAESGYEKVMTRYSARTMWTDMFTTMGYSPKPWTVNLKKVYFAPLSLRWLLAPELRKLLPLWLRVQILSLTRRWGIELAGTVPQ